MLTETVSAYESRYMSPVLAIKFSVEDLPLVAQILSLKSIQSCMQHNGSSDLYLFEQVAFLDSLTSVEPPTLKKRRMRHQHFWRDSDKLAANERVYVKSADVQLAVEAGLPVTPTYHLSQSEHTSNWTVCLTALGAKEVLNRKISPLGVRLFRAMQSQLELQQNAAQVLVQQSHLHKCSQSADLTVRSA